MNVSSSSISLPDFVYVELDKIIDKIKQGNVPQEEKAKVAATAQEIWNAAKVYRGGDYSSEFIAGILPGFQLKIAHLNKEAGRYVAAARAAAARVMPAAPQVAQVPKKASKGKGHKKIETPAEAPRKHPGKESVQSKAGRFMKEALQAVEPPPKAAQAVGRLSAKKAQLPPTIMPSRTPAKIGKLQPKPQLNIGQLGRFGAPKPVKKEAAAPMQVEQEKKLEHPTIARVAPKGRKAATRMPKFQTPKK